MNKKGLQNSLIHWFREHQRPLPWRANYDPYQVWISEIMLQQTQVATVLPYFERWMQEVPSIAALATLPEDRLLKLWEGLGYYSRALNLKKAAEQVLRENGGRLYDDFERLLSLPGIGRYTAGAIMSIAYNGAYPVVDGNVVRVLARVLEYRENVKDSGDFFWDQAKKLLPATAAREFNQGLMELGALVCTPKKPACAGCPIKDFCLARRAGVQEKLPVKSKKSKEALSVVLGIIQKNGKVFIQKRPAKGLMAGLWEFPGGKIEKGESAEDALKRELEEELGISVNDVRPFMRLKHAYTRFQVDLQCFLSTWERGEVALKVASEGKWVRPEDLKHYAFPAANKKIILKYLTYST